MAERLKRVLVAYSTLSGCTATIAKRIGTDLIAYAACPVVASVSEMPLVKSGYDAVIFGSGMRMGKWHKEARDWLMTNIDALSTLPVAFFSVGLLGACLSTGRNGQADHDLESAIPQASSLKPVGSVALPGWKRSEGFNTVEKLVMRVYPLEDGDYRDWDKTDAWVRSVAPVLLGNGPQLGNYVQIQDKYQIGKVCL